MLAYNIYLYRWLLSGRPFYVGSTRNLQNRDRAHSRYLSSKADSVIQGFGRDRFTLEVLEVVTGTDVREVRKVAHTKENEYIIKFNTLEKHGGGNRALNPVSRGPRMKHAAITISEHEFHAFSAICDRLGKNKSQMIRNLVCQFIKANQ